MYTHKYTSLLIFSCIYVLLAAKIQNITVLSFCGHECWSAMRLELANFGIGNLKASQRRSTITCRWDSELSLTASLRKGRIGEFICPAAPLSAPLLTPHSPITLFPESSLRPSPHIPDTKDPRLISNGGT